MKIFFVLVLGGIDGERVVERQLFSICVLRFFGVSRFLLRYRMRRLRPMRSVVEREMPLSSHNFATVVL